MHGKKLSINQVFIHEQLRVSKEGTLDEAKIALKRIIGPHPFVENEQWSVVCMKEKFDAKAIAILQFFYQKEQLVYFRNKIVITFDLANMGQLVNWCCIMLTHSLINLTCWTKH
jgi:hypothetical protein